jgi:hypothetical protein
MNDRQPINNLKIKYDNKTYDKIMYVSIRNTDEYSKYEVSFENKENEKETININCMLNEIEITTK